MTRPVSSLLPASYAHCWGCTWNSLLTGWLGVGQVGLDPCSVRTHWVTTTCFMRLLSIPRLRAYLGATWPLLVMSGDIWYIQYISTRETHPANRERLPRVHASTAPADQRRAAPHPMPRCAPGSLTLEDTPTAAVWTIWLRGLGYG